MSENITHIAIKDDCFRLIAATDGINALVKQAAGEHGDFARLGSVTRYGDRFNVGLLAGYRDAARQGAFDEESRAHLGFVLGWMCHRAADRIMKPVFRRIHPQKLQRPTECSVYHDTFVLREIYGLDEHSDYAPLLDRGGVDIVALGRAALQSALIELHTLKPPDDGVDQWIGQLHELHRSFYVNLERYQEAFTNPDPEKTRRFIVEDGFYDAEEPLIAAARAIQQGEEVTGKRVAEAAAAQPRSHYGRALSMAYGYLCAASELLDGAIDEAQLTERLNIGKPGEDGKAV